MVPEGHVSPTQSLAENGRLGLIGRSGGRLKLTLGIAVAVLTVAGLVIGIEVFQTRSEVDEARRHNFALRAQQQALRTRTFELSDRLIQAEERRERVARLAGGLSLDREPESPPLPTENAGNEAPLDWLSEQPAGPGFATGPLTPTVSLPDVPLLQSAYRESIGSPIGRD